ncbi:hypothetical protein [Streptomyces sp. NPDC102437]
MSVRGTCHADDVARAEAAEAVRLQAAAPPESEDGQEPDRGRGWFGRQP